MNRTRNETAHAGWFGAARVLRLLPALWAGILLTVISVHLVHQIIGYGVVSWNYSAGLPGWFGVSIALGAALLFACLIHYSIENPLCDGSGRGAPAQTLPKPL
ncbi:MAG: hypothetical protein V7760_05705 [Marinobacter sp.]